LHVRYTGLSLKVVCSDCLQSRLTNTYTLLLTNLTTMLLYVYFMPIIASRDKSASDNYNANSKQQCGTIGVGIMPAWRTWK